MPSIRHLRWAALLKHQDAKEAKTILKELKMDNDTIAKAGLLVHWWKYPIGINELEVRKTNINQASFRMICHSIYRKIPTL